MLAVSDAVQAGAVTRRSPFGHVLDAKATALHGIIVQPSPIAELGNSPAAEREYITYKPDHQGSHIQQHET